MWGFFILIVMVIWHFNRDKIEQRPPPDDPLWEDPYFMAMILEEGEDDFFD